MVKFFSLIVFLTVFPTKNYSIETDKKKFDTHCSSIFFEFFMRELKFRFTGELVQNREISGYLKSNKNYIINKSYYKAVKSFMESLAEKPFPKTSQNSEKDLLAFQDWIKKSSAKGGENNEIIIEKNIDLAKNNAKTLWKKCIRMEMDNAECKQLKVNSPKLFACAQKSTKSNNEFYNIILGDFERMKKCVLQGKCY